MAQATSTIKPKPYKFKIKFYRYNGISAAEAKGRDPRSVYVGKLCPGRLLWPSDIAAFYETMQSIRERLANIQAREAA
jgi:hypothetical protein